LITLVEIKSLRPLYSRWS